MSRWRRVRRSVVGRKHAIAATLLAVAVLAGVVAGLLKLDVSTSVTSFVASSNAEARMNNEVAAAFGGDPIVVLLESRPAETPLAGDQLPRLLALEGRLAALPDVASVYGPATVLNQLAGQAQLLLAELAGRRDGLRASAEHKARAAGATPEAVREAGAREVAGFDRRYGVLVVEGLPTGLPTLRNDHFVRSAVFTQEGDPRPQWRFVVPARNAVAVLVRPRQGLSQEAVDSLVGGVRRAVAEAGLSVERVTVSGVPTVVAAMGNQARREVPLLGAIALVAVGAWFFFVRWTRRRWRLLPVLTTAVATSITLALFGWANHPLSLGVVAFLPVLLGVGSDFMTYLHRRVGRRVVAAAALATAASFGSLAVTPIPAVRELGLTLALGIAVSLGVGLLAARLVADGRNEKPLSAEAVRRSANATCGRRAARPTRILIGALIAALGIVGWTLLPGLPLRADMESFAAGLPVLADAEHASAVIGSSGEVIVALSGPNTVTPDALRWMRDAQEVVIAHHGDKMHPVLSPPALLRFLGGAPTEEQIQAALRLLPRYLTSSVIRADQRLSVLSFGVELADAESLRTLRDDLQRLLPAPPAGMEVTVTGLPMIALSAYERISDDRLMANLLGILSAGVVLAVVLRRRADALRAVGAAAVATGVGLCAVWLTKVELTPLTVALGALTAAVGCEFTVVLAEAARRQDREMRRGVLLAAAASTTGYAVLVLSNLSLVRGFGVMLAGAVVLAWLSAELVVWLSIRPPRQTGAEWTTEQHESRPAIGVP